MSNHACTFFKYVYETGNRQKWLLPWSLWWIQDGITDWGCGRVIGSPKPLGDHRRPRLHRPCRDVRSHSTLKGG